MAFLLLLAAFGTGTIVGGWWGLALVGLGWGFTGRAVPWRAGAAAALAWVLLLGFTVQWAPLARLAPKLGGVVGLPGWVFAILMPLFAWLLAWSATRVSSGMVPPRRPSAKK